MIILDVEQGTDEWLESRLGIPTASCFKKVFTATGKPSSSVDTYMYELIGERLTGKQANEFKTEWMDRGNELEPMAREAYGFIYDNDVEQVGFVLRDDREVGCSPDGLIGDDGMLEIKCPKASTHVKYLLSGKLPAEYRPQVQGQLWLAEREWCDFMSYHPDCAPLIVRVCRDEKYISKLAAAVDALVGRMSEAIQKLSTEAV